MADSGEYTPETIASRQKIADALLMQAVKPREIRHWAQGLGQLGEASLGGYLGYKAEEEQKAGTGAQAAAIAALLSGGGSPGAAAPEAPAGPTAPIAAGPDRPPDNPNIPAPPQRMASLSPEPGIVAPPRAVVPSSAKVIGDEEGVALGLYDPPKTPGTAPPSQVAQNAPAATPGVPAPAGAPNNKAAIAKMLQDPNPYVRKMGIQLGQAAVAKQLTQQPKYHKLDDETLFEEGSGATKAAGPGYRSITDPAERAKFGIPVKDERPYQVRGGKLINPPAETRLSIDQRGEVAFDQAAGKHQAERFDKLVTAGMDAKGMRADVGALKDIGSRITTGKTAQITEALGPYAEALGVKIDGLGDLQAYESIISKLAPRMRVAGSGATSDFEMKTFLKALPGLGKTPEGNAIIQSTMDSLQDHQEKAAEIASRAMNKELTPREADKMLRELPDPLTAWKKSKGVSKLGESGDALRKKYGLD